MVWASISLCMISQLFILYFLFIYWDFSAPKWVTRVLGFEVLDLVFHNSVPCYFSRQYYDVRMHTTRSGMKTALLGSKHSCEAQAPLSSFSLSFHSHLCISFEFFMPFFVVFESIRLAYKSVSNYV